ncbi:hypothetical protein O3M35_004230 [Rhynocoris fuscipes]|uniref:ornithine decarboxylase n=1 Tax=Rhynocoris fuscipes TaxID=488301 RepID=A0AAW1CFF2_9HEMI
MNMTDLVQKYNEWTTNLPKIRPFYAVKCNDSLAVIKILSSLGCGFDCASMGEIKKVMSLGVSSDDIIYANPAKPISHLQYAQKVGVKLMTFDSVTELEKIKKYFPDAKVVLRIRADAIEANVPLGIKFGCEPEQAREVIATAAKLQLNLVGFSFHVGTGCKEPGAYPRAIRIALSLIPTANEFGYNLTILDIGGGYPGDASAGFYEISRLINECLEEENEHLNGLTLMAEPGRYFVCTAYKLATTVIGIRETKNRVIYTINDSIFGLFNCVKTESIFKIPKQLNESCEQKLERHTEYIGIKGFNKTNKNLKIFIIFINIFDK